MPVFRPVYIPKKALVCSECSGDEQHAVVYQVCFPASKPLTAGSLPTIRGQFG
jgi:hypothetical protein